MSIADIRRQASYGGVVTRALEKWRLDHERQTGRKPDGWWHPSSLSGCPTAAVYEQLGFPLASPPHDARLLRIFDTGHACHHMLQSQFVNAGIISMLDRTDSNGVAIKTPAVEVPIQDSYYNLRGTLDVIFNVGKRFVGELKTKHSMSFAKMTEPDPKHIIQVTCYHWKSADLGYVDSDRACVLYYSKDDSHIREFMEPITDQRIGDVKAKLDCMNNMQSEFKVKGTVPEPFYKDSHKPPCRTCPWAPVCFATITREAWINKIKETTNAQVPAAQETTGEAKPRRVVPSRKR